LVSGGRNRIPVAFSGKVGAVECGEELLQVVSATELQNWREKERKVISRI